MVILKAKFSRIILFETILLVIWLRGTSLSSNQMELDSILGIAKEVFSSRDLLNSKYGLGITSFLPALNVCFLQRGLAFCLSQVREVPLLSLYDVIQSNFSTTGYCL